MDVKAIISLVVLACVALGITFWIAGDATSTTGKKPEKKSYSSFDDDSDAPPLDEDGKRPKAVTDETVYQFGAMELGEKRQHTFKIRNEGEDTLVIAQGASTCKCTVSELPDNKIPPGKSAEVHLEWEPKQLSPEFAQGARIWTNDPERRAIDFRVEGTVSSLVEFVPGPVVTAGNILEETGGDARLIIFSELTTDLTKPEISYSGDNLSFETVPASPKELSVYVAKAGYIINIHIAPTVPVGLHKELFEVKFTANGKELKREITLECDRRGPVTIFPVPGTVYVDSLSLVNFGRFDAEKGKKQAITIMLDDPPNGEEVTMSVGENEFPDMKISIEPNRQLALNKRQPFDVMFQIPPGLPPLNFSRLNALSVKLNTTHPLVKEINLNVVLQSK